MRSSLDQLRDDIDTLDDFRKGLDQLGRPDGGLGRLKDVGLGWIQKKKVSSFTKWDIASNDINWYQLILNDIDYLDSIYNDMDNMSCIKWY